MLSFIWIASVIGEEASGGHGYIFLSFIYYPILLPVYGLLLWFINKYVIVSCNPIGQTLLIRG